MKMKTLCGGSPANSDVIGGVLFFLLYMLRLTSRYNHFYILFFLYYVTIIIIIIFVTPCVIYPSAQLPLFSP